MTKKSNAEVVSGHINLGLANQVFLDKISVVDSERIFIRWWYTVLFYRILMPIRALLIKQGTLTMEEVDTNYHELNRMILLCDDLSDFAQTYSDLKKISQKCRYNPFYIAELHPKVTTYYSEECQKLVDHIGVILGTATGAAAH